VTYLPAESGWWHDSVGEHMEDRAACAPLLAALGLPGEAIDWEVARLSTGEKQRLALIRAVARGPRVLLLDEPTSGLDRDATAAVERLLQSLLANGTAIVLVTHDHEQTRRMADRRLHVAGGQVHEIAQEMGHEIAQEMAQETEQETASEVAPDVEGEDREP
jgi:ABC-type iron transport system FetAB ATPase subunit